MTKTDHFPHLEQEIANHGTQEHAEILLAEILRLERRRRERGARPRCAGILRGLLVRYPSERIAATAVDAAAELMLKELQPELCAGLKDNPDDFVRFKMVRTLHRFGDPRNRALLEDLARSDASPMVRHAAREALESLT